jgi:hypothetical protein
VLDPYPTMQAEMIVNLRHSLAAAKPALSRQALLALHASGAHRVAPDALRGMGAIFMLHRVREPDADTGFAPNRILEVTPDFLDAAIRQVQASGYVCLSLDEAVSRIVAGDTSDRFAVFTLDDGYKDNLTVAAPVFSRHNVPFTVYLATGLPDGAAELWWVALERVIAGAREVRLRFPDGEMRLTTASAADKNAAWNAVYWKLRGLGETALRVTRRSLAVAPFISHIPMATRRPPARVILNWRRRWVSARPRRRARD